MNEKYHSGTWIDHGMETGDSNRETFVCDGLDPKSEFYVSDLWEKYAIQYFWNCSREKLHENIPIKKKLQNYR